MRAEFHWDLCPKHSFVDYPEVSRGLQRNCKRPSHLVIRGMPPGNETWLDVQRWLNAGVFPAMAVGATVELTSIEHFRLKLPKGMRLIEDD